MATMEDHYKNKNCPAFSAENKYSLSQQGKLYLVLPQNRCLELEEEPDRVGLRKQLREGAVLNKSPPQSHLPVPFHVVKRKSLRCRE